MFKKMQKQKKIMAILLIILMAIYLAYNIFLRIETYGLSKYGSRGNEVSQIQTKLKRWGYYTGSIDGIYGSKTVAAVKWFQRKNGLTADRNCSEQKH